MTEDLNEDVGNALGDNSRKLPDYQGKILLEFALFKY